jgi:hypothetical protein
MTGDPWGIVDGGVLDHGRIMGYPGGPMSYHSNPPFSNTLCPVGGRPPAGLKAAQGLVANRANLVFKTLDPLWIRWIS